MMNYDIVLAVAESDAKYIIGHKILLAQRIRPFSWNNEALSHSVFYPCPHGTFQFRMH